VSPNNNFSFFVNFSFLKSDSVSVMDGSNPGPVFLASSKNRFHDTVPKFIMNLLYFSVTFDKL
jgi:hypothetical protein